MFRILDISSKSALSCAVALTMLIPLHSAWAKKDKDKVLYSFAGGSDGAVPYAGLVADKNGNLYGTTNQGGDNGCTPNAGCGTVFKLAPDGTETVLYPFTGGSDGGAPYAGLIEDKAGNLYSTTEQGGANGYGAVFKLSPQNGGWSETVLYSFMGGNDGADPYAGLIEDKAGNLYGTTYKGGSADCANFEGCGTVFKLAPNGTETVLLAFAYTDGSYPSADLIRDKNGNLYGTTTAAGEGGYGTAFKLAPDGTETVLHAFTGENGDGATPDAVLIEDKNGNLYGTTTSGGSGTGCGIGCGTVFKLAPDGTETVLHSFSFASTDGIYPSAGLIRDTNGNLYGTTSQGGTYGTGTVFSIAPTGTEKVLYSFNYTNDGTYPYASLIMDKKGYLYGTTSQGGGTGCFEEGCGTVFRLKE